MSRKLSKEEVRALSKLGLKFGREISSGRFATVYKLHRYKGRQDLCVKYFYNVNSYERDRINKEFDIAREMYESNSDIFVEVVDMFEFCFKDAEFPDNNITCVGMIMEYLQPIDERIRDAIAIAKILYDVSLCLGMMHSKKHIHRDIKPQNILLKRSSDGRFNRYVVCDFGISYSDCTDTFTDSECGGTLYYMPPDECDKIHSLRGDFYSLGMICRERLCGMEFVPSTDFEELKEQKRKLLPLECDDPVNMQMLRIINKLTEYDRNDRYSSCEQLLYDIRAWLKIYEEANNA